MRVREGSPKLAAVDRAVEMHMLPCNWLQCMDNSADPVHFEFLHAAFGNYQLKKLGRPPAMTPATKGLVQLLSVSGLRSSGPVRPTS